MSDAEDVLKEIEALVDRYVQDFYRTNQPDNNVMAAASFYIGMIAGTLAQYKAEGK